MISMTRGVEFRVTVCPTKDSDIIMKFGTGILCYPREVSIADARNRTISTPTKCRYTKSFELL